jgi:hypothetical protein
VTNQAYRRQPEFANGAIVLQDELHPGASPESWDCNRKPVRWIFGNGPVGAFQRLDHSRADQRIGTERLRSGFSIASQEERAMEDSRDKCGAADGSKVAGDQD